MQGDPRRTRASQAWIDLDPTAIRRRIGFLLRQTQQVFHAALVPELAALGVTPAEAEVATALAARPGGFDQIALARFLGLGLADLILIADGLEMKGLAARTLAEHRRRTLVPTPRTHRLARQADSIQDSASAVLWAPILPAEADDLKEALLALAHNGASDAPAWAPEGERLPLFERTDFLLRRSQQVLAALFHEEASAFGLTMGEYGELARIAAFASGGPSTLKLYAAARSSLAPTIKLLEARGYIARRRDPLDRRRRTLALEAGGAEVLREMQPAVTRMETRFLAPLDAAGERFRDELAHLVRTHGAA